MRGAWPLALPARGTHLLQTFLNSTEGISALLSALSTIFSVWAAKVLQGRVRLVYFSPPSTFFTLKNDGDPIPVQLRSGQVMIQNLGRLAATDVEVIASAGPPAGYTLVPPVSHSAEMNSHGNWVLKINFIAPKEVITVQILNGPNIDSVRSADCVAKYVPVVHQRQFPAWFNASAVFLMLVGVVSIFYIFWRSII